MPGKQVLSCNWHSHIITSTQIDQALVSLVDKEKMRAKQANILEILKAWLKASAAERSQLAAASAEIIATEAKADNKVSQLQ